VSLHKTLNALGIAIIEDHRYREEERSLSLDVIRSEVEGFQELASADTARDSSLRSECQLKYEQ
jgi:hypothetical protein